MGPDILVPKFWRQNKFEVNIIEKRPKKIESKLLKNKYRASYNHDAWKFDTGQESSARQSVEHAYLKLDETWTARFVLDPTDHPRRSPSRKQTMAIRMDKVIGIPVIVLVLDTRFGPKYIFPKSSTTCMYYYYQLQYLIKLILTLSAEAHLAPSWKSTKELPSEKKVLNATSISEKWDPGL